MIKFIKKQQKIGEYFINNYQRLKDLREDKDLKQSDKGKNMGYYQRLKDLREDKEITQEELAKIIYTSQRQYSRWETGQYDIPFEIIIKLANYYNVSIDYIAGITNDKRGIGYSQENKYNINQYNKNNGTINIKE